MPSWLRNLRDARRAQPHSTCSPLKKCWEKFHPGRSTPQVFSSPSFTSWKALERETYSWSQNVLVGHFGDALTAQALQLQAKRKSPGTTDAPWLALGDRGDHEAHWKQGRKQSSMWFGKSKLEL